jgi:hypothetical protein
MALKMLYKKLFVFGDYVIEVEGDVGTAKKPEQSKQKAQ